MPEFNSVHANVEAKYDEYETKRLSRQNRKRKVGAGHPYKLPLQERLLMFFIYYRLYITSTLTGVLFELDQSNVLKDIRKLEPLLKDVLPTPKKLHDKARRLQTLQEIEAMFPDWRTRNDLPNLWRSVKVHSTISEMVLRQRGKVRIVFQHSLLFFV